MSGRGFRSLMRLLLPADVRGDYGNEMERAFREERRDAASAGRLAVLRVWARTLRDLLAVGPREHVAQLRQDVRDAVRASVRQPGFTLAVILILALGIGASTAIFSIVHAVLLEPLPYAEPSRLVAVWNRWDGTDAASLSNPEFLDYAEATSTLEICGMTTASVNVTGFDGESERVLSGLLTPAAFTVLGVVPALGRPFREDEGRPGASAAVLLSDGYWRRRFAADPGIVGRRIAIDGADAEVVGVMPRGVRMPSDIRASAAAELFLPLVLDPAAPRSRRGGHYIRAVARLKPGVYLAAASSDMDAIVARLATQYPDEHDQGNFRVVLRPLRDDLLGSARPVLLVLCGAVALVLLLACANVATLLLARAEARQRDLAVRAALGASRLRLARQLLTEACFLSLAGAAAGLLVALGVQRIAIAAGAAALPRLADAELNAPVLAFTTALAIAAGLLFGVVPACQLSRRRLDSSLKVGGRGTSAGRTAIRRALVVAQVAAAVALIAASGLLVKSFLRLTAVPAGIDADRVLTMRVTLPAARYAEQPQIASFFERLLERVRALPGVVSAGMGTGVPLASWSGDWSFDIDGRPRVGTRYPGAADWYAITEGYLETLRIPLVRGRWPRVGDAAGDAPVVLINEETRRTLFPNEDPIGRRIRFARGTGGEQPWRTIVGIVGNVRYRGLDEAVRPEVLIPHAQVVHYSGGQVRSASLVVRTAGDPMAMAAAVRAELGALDRHVAAAQVRDMHDVIRRSVSDRRLHVMLVSAFAALAVILSSAGLYGLLAYTVAQRTRELGLRLALGASRLSVLRLVLHEALVLVLLGSTLGLTVAIVASGAFADLLFDVRPRDAGVLAGAISLLTVVGALASVVPARRASRVDPVVALRGEG